MSILSPTTLPADVVAEVFPLPRPSRKSTSFTAGPPPSDGNGRFYSFAETPMRYCDSPVPRFCTGNCRTDSLNLQQLDLNDLKADVVHFFNLVSFYICTRIISRARFVSRRLKIPRGLGTH